MNDWVLRIQVLLGPQNNDWLSEWEVSFLRGMLNQPDHDGPWPTKKQLDCLKKIEGKVKLKKARTPRT